MLNILYYIFYFFQAWISIYLLLPFLFLLVYIFKKGFNLQYNIYRKKPLLEKKFSFAAIVTAHEETRLIAPLVDSLLKQTYPNLQIYVVADACKDISTLVFNDARVTILKPVQDLNSKIKSIDYALNNFITDHDVLVIFDSDNLVHPDYMDVLNRYFNMGFRAVQTNLQPKNTDSLYARLDSIGDIYHNFTEREIRMEMGLSSAIWGLGIAIETSLYKSIIYQNFLGGFDKRIQADIVRQIPQLAFAKEAMVYDEKISSGKALETQRTRWINAYFKYFKLAWAVFIHGIKKLDLNTAFFGFINLRPPLFIVLGLALLFAIVNIFINTTMALLWTGLLILFVLTFFTIIVIKCKDKKTIGSLIYLPLFVLRQVLALFKIKKANKSFLKTEHNKVIYIDDLIKNEPA